MPYHRYANRPDSKDSPYYQEMLKATSKEELSTLRGLHSDWEKLHTTYSQVYYEEGIPFGGEINLPSMELVRQVKSILDSITMYQGQEELAKDITKMLIYNSWYDRHCVVSINPNSIINVCHSSRNSMPGEITIYLDNGKYYVTLEHISLMMDSIEEQWKEIEERKIVHNLWFVRLSGSNSLQKRYVVNATDKVLTLKISKSSRKEEYYAVEEVEFIERAYQ